MDCAQGHIGLARAALGDDARCLCLAQILGSPSNGKPLSWERLAQKGRYCRSNGVFGALQWRKGFKNSASELDRVRAQIIEGSLHRDAFHFKLISLLEDANVDP